MRIVFMERNSLGLDVRIDRFRELGEVVCYGASDPQENANRIKDADIVVVNKIPMNAAVLDGAKNLKLICLTATGTNNVDFDYVNKRNIIVENVSGYSTESVLLHTFTMLLFLFEHISYYDSYVKNGEYEKSGGFSHFGRTYHELHGKTWGIIGLGTIGRRVAEVASAFGCNVIYYSTSGKNNDETHRRVELSELLRESDVISIHCPLNQRTKGLIAADELAQMKKSAYILNLGRGGIIDEQALYDALVNNTIAGAGLDVLSAEPIRADNPLNAIKDSEKLIITPHQGWGAIEARQRCIDETYENISAFLRGEDRNRVFGGV
ncbi:MAG: D-2-hydroxyacid dehydrogenase [Lachnospiraceae bacterium]|nr:D-2-hydroxyacid dehydrogenase [Lachnospiraceae bacterium]